MNFNQAKFAAVVAQAKAGTNDRRWLAAIDRAAAGIASGWWIVTELADCVAVTTECGKTYFASDDACQCRAFELGQPCKHRSLARLIEMYNAQPEPEMKPGSPRIIRSVERDRFGARHVVERCDGWMI
jgi:hypothetical protein